MFWQQRVHKCAEILFYGKFSDNKLLKRDRMIK